MDQLNKWIIVSWITGLWILITRHHGIKKTQEKTIYVFDGSMSPKLKQSVAWCVCPAYYITIILINYISSFEGFMHLTKIIFIILTNIVLIFYYTLPLVSKHLSTNSICKGQRYCLLHFIIIIYHTFPAIGKGFMG
jgi:antibiotic biosynthesis monooxygenase (ABM) superfamily enzyme